MPNEPSAPTNGAVPPPEASAARAVATDDTMLMPALAGAAARGRKTLEASLSAGALFNTALLPPASPDSQWQLLDLDSNALAKMSPTDLIKLIVDVSPDVSRAVWDFLRLSNPGWEVSVYRPGTEEEEPRGTQAIKAFFSRLRSYYGAVDVPINRLLIGAWLRGAFYGELVLGPGLVPFDLATPDPALARFKRVRDPIRGEIWQLGQMVDGEFVPLDSYPTVAYIPIDPLSGVPYGRPLVSPSLFCALFALGILHDLRRVLRQQGYSRTDVSIDLEAIKNSMPRNLVPSAAIWKKWVDQLVSETQNIIGNLQPDDTYVHTNASTVNRAPGAVDTSALAAVDGMFKALERMLVRALKTMPLLMGITDGVSEANANRQWEVHAAGVKALQHLLEEMLAGFFKLALRAQGIQADVEFEFAELRAAEMLRDEQTDALKIANALSRYLLGVDTMDEMSAAIAGHEPAREFPIAIPTGFTAFTDPDAEPEAEPTDNLPDANPNAPPAETGAQDAQDVNADPGSERAVQFHLDPPTHQVETIRGGVRSHPGVRLSGRRRGRPGRRHDFWWVKRRNIVGSGLPLPAIPDQVAITDDDKRMALALFDVTFPEYAGLLGAEVVE